VTTEGTNVINANELEEFRKMPPSVQAALLRIARRIGEGFQGSIEIAAHAKGIRTIAWKQVEHQGGAFAPCRCR
jgi:hypothetical protein